MKKDIEYQGSNIEMMRSDATEFIKSQHVESILNVMKRDQIMYTDEKVKGLNKDVMLLIEQKYSLLDDLPTSSNYVKRMDFQRFVEHFRLLKDSVDRVTDVLLEGYKTEANHILKSKVSKTEVEDMLRQKFDRDRGKEMEKSVKETKARVDTAQAKIDNLDQ